MHVFQRKNEVKIPKFSGLRPDPDVEKQGGIFAKGGFLLEIPLILILVFPLNDHIFGMPTRNDRW